MKNTKFETRNSKRSRVATVPVKKQSNATGESPVLCGVCWKKVTGPVDLADLSQVFAGLEGVSILGGNSAKKDGDGFSYWASKPKEIFEFRASQQGPFEKLQYVLDKYKFEDNSTQGLRKRMFCGGWIGYFSYELGRYIERLPETTVDDIDMPLIRLCFYDRLIAYDHIGGDFWLIALHLPDDAERPNDKIASLERLLAKSKKVSVKRPRSVDLDAIDFSQICCNMNKGYYLKAFEKIRRYIYDGDVYQINFSQRFECDYTARPIELYHWENYYNPSPYAAYIGGGDCHIVSASPEMFITIEDGVISTKPIKGTRRRVGDTEEGKEINTRKFEELVKCEKEQAELNMIVDLERNDVARICKAGTRHVAQPRTIESYPTVFHAVATVTGELREGISFCDVLRAMFPGGSITGAPKIRSMEIIDETEPTARGVYTGGIGFVGVDGNVCLNIAIRTIIIKGEKAYAQTGGGIVADSVPEAEWQETITKARALLAGITATQKAPKP